jgi:YfiH family protein
VFAFQDTQGPVEIAFTDRHADTRGGPSASLDLSSGVAGGTTIALVSAAFAGSDDPSSGTPTPRTALLRQVHGADVVVVEDPGPADSEPPVADALVTRRSGVVLLVRVADCVPVLLADPQAGVVAAVHAGRPGLVAGVVPEAVRVMRAHGASTIRGWLGPHVCGACYEVPATMRDQVASVVPEARAETSWGTPSVDLGAGVLAQLRRHGVDDVNLAASWRCTVEDDDLFSYRRQGDAAGRLGGLIWMRP